MDYQLDEVAAVVGFETYLSVLGKIGSCVNNFRHTDIDAVYAICLVALGDGFIKGYGVR